MPSERGHYEEGTMERALWTGHYENKSPQADQSDCSIRHSYVLSKEKGNTRVLQNALIRIKVECHAYI